MAKDLEKKSNNEKKHFWKDFKAELKKVIWPTPKQVVNNTVAVITIVLITAVIVFALDFVFKAINTYGINGLRSITQKESSENTLENEQSDIQEGNETSEENGTLVNNTEITNSTEEQIETVEENTGTAGNSTEQ